MLGWNHSARIAGLKLGHCYDLAGEAIHLAPMSTLIHAVYCQQSAPWWNVRPSVPGFEAGQKERTLATDSGAAAGGPKKRRVGGLKVWRSLQ
jgi:hypothetical protein